MYITLCTFMYPRCCAFALCTRCTAIAGFDGICGRDRHISQLSRAGPAAQLTCRDTDRVLGISSSGPKPGDEAKCPWHYHVGLTGPAQAMASAMQRAEAPNHPNRGMARLRPLPSPPVPQSPTPRRQSR
ncbi:hypothetical protein F4861DRAFT_182715 [Xylaria intraflava]|nr:hypothetical protein F4861DRAFT_182715 [Xylaria intraflava]